MKPNFLSASQIVAIALLSRCYGYTDTQLVELLRGAEADEKSEI